MVSKADGADFSEGAAAGSNVQRTIVPAAKVRPTQGGKGMDWRVWPGGPPGTGSGIGDFGSGQSESWGFYDRADQVDALLAYLNPQVEACSTLSLLLLQSSTIPVIYFWCLCPCACGVEARRECLHQRVGVVPWQGLREGLLYEQLSLRYLKLTGNMRKKASESVKAEREQVLCPPPCQKPSPGPFVRREFSAQRHACSLVVGLSHAVKHALLATSVYRGVLTPPKLAGCRSSGTPVNSHCN